MKPHDLVPTWTLQHEITSLIIINHIHHSQLVQLKRKEKEGRKKKRRRRQMENAQHLENPH